MSKQGSDQTSILAFSARKNAINLMAPQGWHVSIHGEQAFKKGVPL